MLLLGVAVVLTAAAPAHATANTRADGYGNRCAMRGETLPTKHTLRANDTDNSLSRRYYGCQGGALTILSSIGLKKWSPRRKIVEAKRYELGDTIVIPGLPQASINPPARSPALPSVRSLEVSSSYREDRGIRSVQLEHQGDKHETVDLRCRPGWSTRGAGRPGLGGDRLGDGRLVADERARRGGVFRARRGGSGSGAL